MYCHLHQGDWSFYLINEKKTKKKKDYDVLPPSSRRLEFPSDQREEDENEEEEEEGPMMYCHLHRGDWSFYLINEKKTKMEKKKKNLRCTTTFIKETGIYM